MVVGTAFSDQADVVGADINFSASATFTPVATPERTLATGVAVECRALVLRTDPTIPLGRPGARSPGWLVLLKQSEILDAPRERDQIEVTDGRWPGTYIAMTLLESHFSPYWRVQVRVAP